MRTMIEDFRIVPAGHCGSGAMRNLLYHYCDLDLEEGVVFGLGAGLDSVFFTYADAEPPFMLFGRGSSFEADMAYTLGIDYQERMQTDDDAAWEEVRQEVIEGRPTMLSGDIFYLDYREFKVHFPAHRFILLGFDEEAGEVYIADRINSYPETCSMQALRDSRNPPVGISTYNQWGRFNSGKVDRSLPEACGVALGITVNRMLGSDTSQRDLMAAAASNGEVCETGLKGMRTFLEHLRSWPERDNAASHAQYVDDAIIKFGTGGGFFRDHFSTFMHWAREQRPDLVSPEALELAVRAAKQWNELSPTMQRIVEAPGDRELWEQSFEQVEDIYLTESALFNTLGDTVLRAA